MLSFLDHKFALSDDAWLFSYGFNQRLSWYFMSPMTGMVWGGNLERFQDFFFSVSSSLDAVLQVFNVSSFLYSFSGILDQKASITFYGLNNITFICPSLNLHSHTH